jgi:hypothetical protein
MSKQIVKADHTAVAGFRPSSGLRATLSHKGTASRAKGHGRNADDPLWGGSDFKSALGMKSLLALYGV